MMRSARPHRYPISSSKIGLLISLPVIVTITVLVLVPSDRARAWEFIDGSWGYDVARYTELLMRAVESVFVPFGVTASMLRSWLAKELPAEHLRARLESQPPRRYLGPLFELAPTPGSVSRPESRGEFPDRRTH